MYFLGYDLGSSSIKASLVDAATLKPIGVVHEPQKEMEMLSLNPGWAEQDPESWWNHLCLATRKLLKKYHINPSRIKGIGIAYQMHGLVLVDKMGHSLRPSIIWCDGRAVNIGKKAEEDLGFNWCTTNLLNSPGNFTASKLKWVAQNQPGLFRRIYKIMLPGDYIAFRLTGEMTTTVPGISEGVFWDYRQDTVSRELMDYFDFDLELIPHIVDTFAEQGILHQQAAEATGLAVGTPVLYRAGDQPNNALSLNVFEPGEIAATAGTSGVLYAVTESLETRLDSGVNNFAHVNYSPSRKRIGKLLCINGAGIQYRWLMNNLDTGDYEKMNRLAEDVAIGAEDLLIYPFGNGPERMLGNRHLGAHIAGLEFNRHTKAHVCRAALEGIAFSFAYGMELLKAEGIQTSIVRAGNDNMFRAGIFSQTVANLIEQEIRVFHNTGSTGAARACTLLHGDLETYGKKVDEMDFRTGFAPDHRAGKHRESFERWKKHLQQILNYQ